MKQLTKRPRGRPRKPDALVLVQFRVKPEKLAEAELEARRDKIPLVDVYRRWFYRGGGGEAA